MNVKINAKIISSNSIASGSLIYLFFFCVFQEQGLNEKEIKLNLCNIFSILICNKLYLFV